MSHEEIVLLDSDDEEPKDNETSVAPITETNDPKKSEEILVEYNHNDYADLLGPSIATNLKFNSPRPMKFPKKPGGKMPPFALYSQEMREKIQKENPDIGFGDLGRKLGEMWHALQEDVKDDYRKRAREVADAKMKSWKEMMAAIPADQQAQMAQAQMAQAQAQSERQKNASLMKKQKTSGYAIFCSEYRHKLGNIQGGDFYKEVAEAWGKCSEEARRGYDEKAHRINAVEDRKWHSNRWQMQTGMTANRGMMVGNRGRGVRGMPGGQIRQPGYRHPVPNFRGRGRGIYSNSHGQYNQNSSNSSPLVISSVSSLSKPETNSLAGLALPKGISIEKAVPKVTDVQKDAVMVVQSGRKDGMIRPGRGLCGINSGQGMRSMGMRARGTLRPTGPMMNRGYGYNRGTLPVRGQFNPMTNGMRMSRGRAVMNPRYMGAMSMRPPQKRMYDIGGTNMPPMKRSRMAGPSNDMPGLMSNMMSTLAKGFIGLLCRVCGAQHSGNLKLREKPELIDQISYVLNFTINLETDIGSGYPDTICTICCNMVETFFNFKKSVAQSQVMLTSKVEAYKENKAAEAAANALTNQSQVSFMESSEDSIGVDPLECILPNPVTPFVLPEDSQPDQKFGNIMIKQESLKTQVKTSKLINASSEPMTAIFESPMSKQEIKTEPISEGLLQKLDEKEIEQQDTNVTKETSQEGQQKIGLEFEEENDNSSKLEMQDKPESVDNLEDNSNTTETEKANENKEQYGMCHTNDLPEKDESGMKSAVSDDLSHTLDKEPDQLNAQGEANENEDQNDNNLPKQDESSMESAQNGSDDLSNSLDTVSNQDEGIENLPKENEDAAPVTESSVPDDEGIEDSEATPGIEESRPISNDDDYGNIEGTNEEGAIDTDSYDPLMEGVDEETSAGQYQYEEYDDQNLEHMNADEDSDVPMWDEDGNILMDDSDIVYEDDEHFENTENLAAEPDESKLNDGETEQLEAVNALDISDESGLNESRDGLMNDFDPESDELRQG